MDMFGHVDEGIGKVRITDIEDKENVDVINYALSEEMRLLLHL